jgi:hypothetical protein
MNFIRTSLSRAPGEATSEDAMEAMRQRAWLEQGVCVVRPAEIQDDWLRQGLISFAVRL